ncbi:hypothetical protein AGR5A_Cc130005 [Agrobacterium genomosp. 5 str. CFBP 6626]|nr:hypothetical protein AGR5A_Cc130005 [Agrobacterium genomosp. 5 str. CFBP 6626]
MGRGDAEIGFHVLVVRPRGGKVCAEDELVDFVRNACTDGCGQAFAAADCLVHLGIDLEGVEAIGDNAADHAARLDVAHSAKIFLVVLFLAPGFPAALDAQSEAVAVQQVDGDAAEIDAQRIAILNGNQRNRTRFQLVRALIFGSIGSTHAERDLPLAGTAVAGIVEIALRIGEPVGFADIGSEDGRRDGLRQGQRAQAQGHGTQVLLPFHCKNLFHDHIRCSIKPCKTWESGFVEEDATRAQLRRHYARSPATTEMALANIGTWKRSAKTVFLIAKRPAFVTTRGVCARKLRQSRRQDDFAGSDPS